MRNARFAVVVALVAIVASGARASETQWWTSDAASDYAKADARGVVVHADGHLTAGPRASNAGDDSLATVWCMAVLADGSVALGGDRGRIDRWTARDGVRPWVRLGGGQVLALAADGNGVVAGTGPRGLIYRIGAGGDTSVVARTGERYVWALAPAGRGAWFAATGTRGRLLRIENGSVRVVLDTEESNLVSLVADGHGGAFTGGDSKGRVYHFGADGSARTSFDASEDEVRALAMGPDGAVWAAGLSASAVTDDGTPGPGDDDERLAPAKAAVAGGRATIYRIAPDSSTVTWWTAPQSMVFALGWSHGVLHAATGNRSGVYAIEGANRGALLLAPPQGQVTALAEGPGGVLYAATSNPASIWVLGPGVSDAGRLDAPVLDAHRFARFGTLRWTGEGSPRFSTRSGNSDTPDTTWSRWQPLESGGRVASPGGRYLQWRVEPGASGSVDAVSVAYREENQPPRVDDVSVAAQGQNFREGEMSPRSEAVTQTLAGGQRVEYSVSLPGARPTRELPVWARGLRTLQWHASDPNGDPLKYRVEVRSEPAGPWIEIGKDLDASSFTWNTNTLPDGRYRVRVTATDAPGNAIGEERTAEGVSEPFEVDNTPPAIASLELSPEAGAARLTARAHDGQGALVRAEVAVDDGTWRLVAPAAGLADRADLELAVTIPGLAAGDHLVSLRVLDAAGNAATRAAHVTVARAR